MRNDIFADKHEKPVYISPLDFELIFVPHLEPKLLLYSYMIYDMGLRACNLLKLTYGDLAYVSAGYLRMPKTRDISTGMKLSAGVQSLLLSGFVGMHSCDEYLFADQSGKRWTSSKAAKMYEKVSKEAGSVINEVSLYYSWCRNTAEYTFGSGNTKKAKDFVSGLMEKRSCMNVK